MYEAKIIADSLHPNKKDRITTFEVVLPRPFLAEFNTHRVLSRNSESSRAKPPERRLEEMETDLWIPEFGSRVKGMGQGDLPAALQEEAQGVWKRAAASAAGYAAHLNEIGVDKSHINRLLEPFVWQRIVVTADTWENFFALRTHEGAAPEFWLIASMMQVAMYDSEPRQLENPTYWHVPYITPDEWFQYHNGFLKIRELLATSVGRCAAVSYDTISLAEMVTKSIDRGKRLADSGHWSPFEHQARPRHLLERNRRGNLVGRWSQLRKMHKGEDVFTG